MGFKMAALYSVYILGSSVYPFVGFWFCQKLLVDNEISEKFYFLMVCSITYPLTEWMLKSEKVLFRFSCIGFILNEMNNLKSDELFTDIRRMVL